MKVRLHIYLDRHLILRQESETLLGHPSGMLPSLCSGPDFPPFSKNNNPWASMRPTGRAGRTSFWQECV